MIRLIPMLLALLGGAVLAMMIALNSQLYAYVSPLIASWIAHGTGAVAALGLLLLMSRRRRHSAKPKAHLPWWAYMGGVSGALLVVLAIITVNGFLGITGTLVLSIVGQVVFGLFNDQFGWFGLDKHPVTKTRIVSVVPIVVGSLLIVYAKGALA